MRRFLLLSLLPALSACAHLTIFANSATPSSGEVHHVELSSYILGLVPGRDLPAQAQLCPETQIERIDLKMDSSDVLLTLVTLGIYVPHRADVICTKG